MTRPFQQASSPFEGVCVPERHDNIRAVTRIERQDAQGRRTIDYASHIVPHVAQTAGQEQFLARRACSSQFSVASRTLHGARCSRLIRVQTATSANPVSGFAKTSYTVRGKEFGSRPSPIVAWA